MLDNCWCWMFLSVKWTALDTWHCSLLVTVVFALVELGMWFSEVQLINLLIDFLTCSNTCSNTDFSLHTSVGKRTSLALCLTCLTEIRIYCISCNYPNYISLVKFRSNTCNNYEGSKAQVPSYLPQLHSTHFVESSRKNMIVA